MLRPSYAELMEVLNKDTEDTSEITSRYTIVIAAAKRARQLIDGDSPMVNEKKGKPLSTAVDEIYESKIKVVPEGEGTVLHLKKDFNEKEYFEDTTERYQEMRMREQEENQEDFDAETAGEIDDEFVGEIDDEASEGGLDDEFVGGLDDEVSEVGLDDEQ